jgi:hypothetical protein
MRILTLLIFSALLFTAPLRADELKSTKEGTITAAKMPKPQDRGEASKAAAAAAAAGAAKGQVNCMMMMNEARKESGQNKTMMMMLASQQCAQATQLQISAMQNNKSQKELSASDIPTPATFTAGKTELDPGKVKETALTFDEAAPSRGLVDKGEIPVEAPIVADLGPKKPVTDPQQGAAAKPDAPASTLPPLKPGSIQFDESGKNPAVPVNASAGSMPFGMGNTSNPTTGGLGKQDSTSTSSIAREADENTPTKRRSRGAATESFGMGGGGADNSSGGTGGDEALDALMAQLGGAPPEEMLESAPGQMWSGADAPANNPVDRANIFEYATVRFTRLTTDRRLGGPSEVKAPERSLASVKN